MFSGYPKTTAEAVETYLAGCDPASPLSIRHGVRAVRMMLHYCESTDAELAELLAAEAIARGFSVVAFNRRTPPRDVELPVY